MSHLVTTRFETQCLLPAVRNIATLQPDLGFLNHRYLKESRDWPPDVKGIYFLAVRCPA